MNGVITTEEVLGRVALITGAGAEQAWRDQGVDRDAKRRADARRDGDDRGDAARVRFAQLA